MGKRTRPCGRDKNLSGLCQVSFNFAHNGVSTLYRVADVDTHDSLASKTLFKFDADIFGQNHHIGACHVFRSQFIFQTNRPLGFYFHFPAFRFRGAFQRLCRHISMGNT
ncbi:hypothetical protein UTI89_C4541 [Escherichia coli UTI89]|uniref:Uncharacterized protein n=2 Tax=Escherichia coli TaxID=562 RepID=A0A0H2Z4J5_ECOK1|nr:hypothetical protein UTI89_C4541 [Escherichia coli UTI89]ABJ03418.1 conserved hypothetical protein [Escherichia coli APEC O1]